MQRFNVVSSNVAYAIAAAVVLVLVGITPATLIVATILVAQGVFSGLFHADKMDSDWDVISMNAVLLSCTLVAAFPTLSWSWSTLISAVVVVVGVLSIYLIAALVRIAQYAGNIHDIEGLRDIKLTTERIVAALAVPALVAGLLVNWQWTLAAAGLGIAAGLWRSFSHSAWHVLSAAAIAVYLVGVLR